MLHLLLPQFYLVPHHQRIIWVLFLWIFITFAEWSFIIIYAILLRFNDRFFLNIRVYARKKVLLYLLVFILIFFLFTLLFNRFLLLFLIKILIFLFFHEGLFWLFELSFAHVKKGALLLVFIIIVGREVETDFGLTIDTGLEWSLWDCRVKTQTADTGS